MTLPPMASCAGRDPESAAEAAEQRTCGAVGGDAGRPVAGVQVTQAIRGRAPP
jgi:hypothetical protein